MEGKSLIYAPNWVKALSVLVLVSVLAAACGLAAFYVGREGRQDWVLVSMSLAQAAASGLVLGLVVFFSERDVNVRGLHKRCEWFLQRTMPDALLLVDYPMEQFGGGSRKIGGATLREVRKRSRTRVEVAHAPGDVAGFYRVHALDRVLHTLVKVNVWEVVVSYYFPVADVDEAEAVKGAMQWAFDGYTYLDNFTMSWNVDQQTFDDSGQLYAGFHFKKEYGPDFLEDERSKVFLAQMVTALTRSLIREAKGQDVKLSVEASSSAA